MNKPFTLEIFLGWLPMLGARVSQHFLVCDTDMQGTFWGGEGVCSPLTHLLLPSPLPSSLHCNFWGL